jgi:hypothetical protein
MGVKANQTLPVMTLMKRIFADKPVEERDELRVLVD